MITTTDRTAISRDLFAATLGEVLADLPTAELEALRRAIAAARNVEPLDVALVELAIIADVAAETREVH